ncbi:hypothetical protein R1flu_021379 [Riccia fluitans]|uniref:Uncharacterized protein n=1 Tax=Riccia fluitans TaxID=41844 RepID=A0ABD1ZP84_9MARC
MSFADLFARYREMGAIGPQPCDDPAFMFDEDGNCWTHSNNGECKNARKADDGEAKQENRTSFKPSPFQLTPEGNIVRVSIDEDLEMLFSSSRRVGLNLGLLKNNVCKDYYKLTSNVLRSLITGIKEIASEEIKPAWQTAVFPSSQKSFSSIFVNKLNDDATLSKLTMTQSNRENEQSKLTPSGHPTKLQIRDEVNIADLRRWLWGQIGHPVNYFTSTSPLEEKSATDTAVESRVAATSDGAAEIPVFLDLQEPTGIADPQPVQEEVQPRENQCEVKDQMTSCSSQVGIFEDSTSSNTAEVTSCKPDENKAKQERFTNGDSSSNQETSAGASSSSSENSVRETAEEDGASKKLSTDCESDHEPLIRRTRPDNQTANGNKQFASSLRIKEARENPKALQARDARENVTTVLTRENRENTRTYRTRDAREKMKTAQTAEERETSKTPQTRDETELGRTVQTKEIRENPRKCDELNRKPTSSKSNQIPVGSRPGEVVDRKVSSSRVRQSAAPNNNEAILPLRPKSWCLVGGYVRRFPTKHHHSSHKSQSTSKSQPQVPTAA